MNYNLNIVNQNKNTKNDKIQTESNAQVIIQDMEAQKVEIKENEIKK